VAATREPVVIPELDLADVVNPLLRARGLSSLAGVPLLAREQLLGGLPGGSLAPRTFTADEVLLLQLAASRIASAIANALLFKRERDARRRLEQIQAVTDTALAQLTLDELLDHLLSRIRDLLSIDTAVRTLLVSRH